MEQGSRPPAPPEFSESRSWGEGPHPHPEVSKGSERGASLAHPHPQSDTPGARRERGRRGAPNNKERSGERQPLPREVGGRRRAALPVPSPGASLLLPSRPPPGVGSQMRCRRRRLGRCDSDPRVPRDLPQHTDTHGGGRGDPHGDSAGRRRQGQRGLSRMRTRPRSRRPAAAPHTRKPTRPP